MLRDTDRDWEVIGTQQPFFGVLANEQFLLQNLTETGKDEFYESGRRDIAKVVDALSRVNGGRFAPRTALDFGCGVGRLTFAMTKYARTVIGVDVAAPMLDVATREATARRVKHVELRADLPSEPVDWVNSLIVFQHIPPARGYAILERLLALLAPGGLLSVQLVFYRDERHTAELVRDLADYRFDGSTLEVLSIKPTDAGYMTMYDYDLNVVMRLLFRAGIDPVTAQHTDHGGCHGAWLFGVKNR